MKSRRLTSSIGRPPAWRRRSVYRMPKLPQRGCQVLGADLNCSESRRCRHTTRQEAAALRDFTPVFVRFGSGADITRLLSNVRFTPESRHRGFDSKCPLCANSGHAPLHSITSSARASNLSQTKALALVPGIRLQERTI